MSPIKLVVGEEVVYRSKLHWVVFLRPLILVPFIFSGSKGGIWYFSFMIVVWEILELINFDSSVFILTNKRILTRGVGLASKTSSEILSTKVETIDVNRGILGSILNYGTITVRGTGGTKKKLRTIGKPHEFVEKVQEQIAIARQ
jgi:uncharacterized membrane protein YdbT with pleckstrin-like domain